MGKREYRAAAALSLGVIAAAHGQAAEQATPPDIDGEHVTAVFEKGVLKVHAPKLASLQPRKIPIAK